MIAIVLGAIFLLVVLTVFFKYLGLYIRCMTSNANIGLFELLMMSLRKVSPETIAQARISAVQAGVDIDPRDLQAHYLAGGNVVSVVRALIAADRAGIALPYKIATGIDLAGRNVLDAVQTCVNPRIIDCPQEAGAKIAAVAKDGIQLLARARVTVRTNIGRLIGGATEETIIARVGEGIVSTIGSANSYKDVLENPDRISKTVLGKGLDAGTAFEILSIDIADVDVGENIGAKLQTDQAEADMRVAEAHAESRRATAVALEQEMQAKVMENRAKLVEAEAQVPSAMAEAFRSGRLGVMDYVRMQNVQADTTMRQALAGGESTPGGASPKKS
ncbi:MAG: flotillin-like protein FloA [Planctomycetes bacterium]|nr:flotillin-like protein FloA [Planctomycetota bacterium]